MNTMYFLKRSLQAGAALALCGALWILLPCPSSKAETLSEERISMQALASRAKVGDLVFTRIPTRLFLKVAEGSGSWTNHVGIVIDTSGPDPLVAESKVPLSTTTQLSKFVARSENGRVALRRLPRNLSETEQSRLKEAATKRLGHLYDLGFDLKSSRQFCSKYVREVLFEATGEGIGEVETFSELLARNPNADQRFWKWWFHGSIPWQRQTVTPASQYKSPRLIGVFDGRVATNKETGGIAR